MPGRAHAQRYAQAVFELAQEKQEMERWQADLRKLAGAVADKEYLAILQSPKIRPGDKARMLAALLGEGNPLALNLARLLISRNSIGIIGDIAREYQRLVDDYHGLLKAEVVTAVPLDEADSKKLAGNLGDLVGKQVELTPSVDPEILGGIIARVGGKLLDGSTRTKLAALKRQLASGEKRR